jgi:hypothetical protein
VFPGTLCFDTHTNPQCSSDLMAFVASGIASRAVSRVICRFFQRLSVKFRFAYPEISAKMAKRKKLFEDPKKTLDAYSEKRRRGRPYKVRASEVSGRAYNYRLIFSQTWDILAEHLLRATTEGEVLQAFEGTAYKNEFEHIASLILAVLHDAKFPKRDKEARISFLADSLAARGVVTPRTSRDICEKARARERAKSPYKIVRKEFYIECSCGYKGPARDDACRKCGAEIPLSFGELWSPRLF